MKIISKQRYQDLLAKEKLLIHVTKICKDNNSRIITQKLVMDYLIVVSNGWQRKAIGLSMFIQELQLNMKHQLF